MANDPLAEPLCSLGQALSIELRSMPGAFCIGKMHIASKSVHGKTIGAYYG